jgi:hypothetical protein
MDCSIGRRLARCHAIKPISALHFQTENLIRPAIAKPKNRLGGDVKGTVALFSARKRKQGMGG